MNELDPTDFGHDAYDVLNWDAAGFEFITTGGNNTAWLRESHDGQRVAVVTDLNDSVAAYAEGDIAVAVFTRNEWEDCGGIDTLWCAEYFAGDVSWDAFRATVDYQLNDADYDAEYTQ